jgi:hypothetical protein
MSEEGKEEEEEDREVVAKQLICPIYERARILLDALKQPDIVSFTRGAGFDPRHASMLNTKFEEAVANSEIFLIPGFVRASKLHDVLVLTKERVIAQTTRLIERWHQCEDISEDATLLVQWIIYMAVYCSLRSRTTT